MKTQQWTGKPKAETKSARLRRIMDENAGLVSLYLREYGNDGNIVLPMPPPMANARWHWRLRHALQDRYRAHCNDFLQRGLIPAPPAKPYVVAGISGVLYITRINDTGNAMTRIEKWPCDWLQAAGYIEDDTPDKLRWTGLPQQVKEKVKIGKRKIIVPRIEIALQEVR